MGGHHLGGVLGSDVGPQDAGGLSLDALGTGQLSYHLMVNASGVQLDMLNSVAGNVGYGLGRRPDAGRIRRTEATTASKER